MNLKDYNAFCAALPHSEHVVQWGGADVWKVVGKLYAIARETDAGFMEVTFKASEIAFHIVKDEEGVRPAPYLASRGMKWLQHYAAPGLSDERLKQHITESYHMAIERLTRKKRGELGL